MVEFVNVFQRLSIILAGPICSLWAINCLLFCMNSFSKYDVVPGVVISAPHAEKDCSRSAVIMLLWDAVTSFLCLLIPLSVDHCAFVYVSEMCSWKQRQILKRELNRLLSTITGLVLIYLHLRHFQCDRNVQITTDNASILRTHKSTSACKCVCEYVFCMWVLCVFLLFIYLIHITLRETVTS